MISFGSKNKQYKYLSKDVSEKYEKCSEAIKKALPVAPDKILLGDLLIKLWQSNSYRVKANEFVDDFNNALKINCHSKVFFLVCEKEFALDKSQVSRYMNIVDEYCELSVVDGEEKPKMVLLEEWQKYSYSQLSEMLSLTMEQRKEVQPEWSIKRIREYKKSLKPVATSQQKEDDFEVPEKYKNLTPRELIECLMERDEERIRLSNALERRGLTITQLLEEEIQNDTETNI